MAFKVVSPEFLLKAWSGEIIRLAGEYEEENANLSMSPEDAELLQKYFDSKAVKK